MHAWSAATPAGGVTADVVIDSDRRPRSPTAPASRAGSASVKGKLVLSSAAAAELPPRLRHSTAWADSAVYHHAVALRDSVVADWSARLRGGARRTRARSRRCSSAPARPVCSRIRGRADGASTRSSRRARARFRRSTSRARTTRCSRGSPSNGQHPRVHAVADAALAPAESPVFNTVARIDGIGETERVRDALGASRFVGRGQRRDRQRHGHDHHARGDAHSENGVSAPEAHDSRRPLERGGGGRHRIVARSRPTIRRSSPACRRCSIRTTARARSTRCRRTASSTRRRRSRGGCRACRLISRATSRSCCPALRTTRAPTADAFDCRGAPAFFLSSSDWSYTDYTWHTNRDTYDKINFDNVKRNATLVAMFAYQASEDPAFVSRTRRVPPTDPRTGQPQRVPSCGTPPRSFAATLRP